MTFDRCGRTYHLKIETAEDLALALDLDEARWVATNAPISTMTFEATFLNLVDTDNNGRIMCHEVKDAIGWLFEVLRDHSGVTEASQSLRLAAIDTDTDEGRRIDVAARKMLARLELADADEVTLSQVRHIRAMVESMPVSEAGVVLPAAAPDTETRQFIADVMATVGGAPHPSGETGITQALLDRFFTDAAAWLDWQKQGHIPPGADKTDVMPLGAKTPEAQMAVEAVRAKIDQYFAQCEAVALDERFVQRMGWTAEELEQLDFDDPAVIEEVLRNTVLAKAKPTGELSFDDRINPYYSEAVERFRREAIEPVLGESPPAFSAAQWRQVKSVFASHGEWLASRPPTPVASLGSGKLQSYLAGPFAEAVRRLIAESTETAFEMDNIRLTEKLVLYQAHMIELANNFVSFPHLYDAARRAMFEMGTMVMDGRRFNFAVRVVTRSEHMAVAKTSFMYLLYVEIAPRGSGPKYEVAVPVTSGGKGNLCVGKRGIFIDIAGNECDARVVSIIDNPINMREALVAPFIRLGRLLTGKIESLTGQAEKKLDARASIAMDRVATGADAAPAPAGQGAGGSTGGMMMGAGVAVAALGSALAYITKTLAETKWYAILIGVAGAVLVVLLPTAVMAILKLRKRDLSAILEGSGWGINAPMRLTGKQGKFFTHRPTYPEGSRGVLRFPWWRVAAVVVLLAVLIGGTFALLRSRRRTTPTTHPTATQSSPDQNAR